MSIPKNDNLLTNKKSHMNKIRNKVQLIGNVGAKPNIEQTKMVMYILKYRLLQMSLNMMLTA